MLIPPFLFNVFPFHHFTLPFNPLRLTGLDHQPTLSTKQSGGDLEMAEDIARIVLNMIKICDTSSFLTDLNSNWINIIFPAYYYSIRNLNKQTVILKKNIAKQITA